MEVLWGERLKPNKPTRRRKDKKRWETCSRNTGGKGGRTLPAEVLRKIMTWNERQRRNQKQKSQRGKVTGESLWGFWGKGPFDEIISGMICFFEKQDFHELLKAGRLKLSNGPQR